MIDLVQQQGPLPDELAQAVGGLGLDFAVEGDVADGLHEQRDQEQAEGDRRADQQQPQRRGATLAVAFEDLFGPVGQRTVESVGYGRHILTGPVHVLDADIGVGARQSTANVTDERSNDAIARLGAKFEGIRRVDRPGRDGNLRDTARYSIVAAEWPQVEARLIELSRRKA